MSGIGAPAVGDVKAKRGMLCVVEFEESSTYLDPRVGTVRRTCLQPARVASVTRAGVVKAVDRWFYGELSRTPLDRLFRFRYCHVVTFERLPADRVDAVLDGMRDALWHSAEDARAAVLAAIGEGAQR